MSEICSKSTIKTHQNNIIDVVLVFVVNFEQISHIVLFLLLTFDINLQISMYQPLCQTSMMELKVP